MAELTKARNRPKDFVPDFFGRIVGSPVFPLILFLAAALYAYRDLIGFGECPKTC